MSSSGPNTARGGRSETQGHGGLPVAVEFLRRNDFSPTEVVTTNPHQAPSPRIGPAAQPASLNPQARSNATAFRMTPVTARPDQGARFARAASTPRAPANRPISGQSGENAGP